MGRRAKYLTNDERKDAERERVRKYTASPRYAPFVWYLSVSPIEQNDIRGKERRQEYKAQTYHSKNRRHQTLVPSIPVTEELEAQVTQHMQQLASLPIVPATILLAAGSREDLLPKPSADVKSHLSNEERCIRTDIQQITTIRLEGEHRYGQSAAGTVARTLLIESCKEDLQKACTEFRKALQGNEERRGELEGSAEAHSQRLEWLAKRAYILFDELLARQTSDIYFVTYRKQRLAWQRIVYQGSID